MKQRSRASKGYPNWRQREMRMFLWALAVGGVAAAIVGLAIWFMNRNGGH